VRGVRLWRISNFSDLSGEGGLLASGRWHSKGRRVVYLADHPASALTEVLVHLEIDVEDMPSHYQLLAIDVADGIASEAVEIADLHADWHQDHATTQARGDRWLAECGTLLLSVPSAITPFTRNWLFNPLHAHAGQARIADAWRVPFDPRLF
jgi:RES domain-containing protein